MKAQHPSGELSMTWTVEFIEASGYVSVVTQGELTRENNQKLTADILSQDFWTPGLNVLLDHRKLCLSATTFEMVRQKVDNFKKHENEIGGGKVAILMDSNLGFARSRQFEMLAEGQISNKIKVFTDELQAKLWVAENLTVG